MFLVEFIAIFLLTLRAEVGSCSVFHSRIDSTYSTDQHERVHVVWIPDERVEREVYAGFSEDVVE